MANIANDAAKDFSRRHVFIMYFVVIFPKEHICRERMKSVKQNCINLIHPSLGVDQHLRSGN